jgi:hypothetical protein
MDFVEQIRIGQERAETGVRAEIDRPPFVISAWEISRIAVAKNAPAKRDELFILFARRMFFRLLHSMILAADSGWSYVRYSAG